MNIEELKKLKREQVSLEKYFSEYPSTFWDYKQINPQTQVDKYHNGFNGDDRFMACASHKVFFSSYKGYYGSSGSSNILSICNDKMFWKYFDEYIRNNQEDIFQFIANGYKKEIKENLKLIDEEIERLNMLKDSLEETK